MKPVTFANYFIDGKKSRWKMTEDEAKTRDPDAKPVPGSEEVRMCPESPEEGLTLTFGHLQNKG